MRPEPATEVTLPVPGPAVALPTLATEMALARIGRAVHSDIIAKAIEFAFTLELDDAKPEHLDAARDLVASLRRVLTTIAQPNFEVSTLGGALLDATQKAAAEFDLEVRWKWRVEDLDQLIDEHIALLAYRTVQELLRNVGTHAGTQQATASLTVTASQLTLSVCDEGRGLDPSRLTPATALPTGGLTILATRAVAAGCAFTVNSQPAAGTTCTLTAPLTGVGASVKIGPAPAP